MSSQLIGDHPYTLIMLRYGTIDAFNYKEKRVNIPKVFIEETGDFFTIKAYKNRSCLSSELPNHVLHNLTEIHSTKNRNRLIGLFLCLEGNRVASLYNALQKVHQTTKIKDYHLGDYYKNWSVLLPSAAIGQYISNKKGMLPVQELVSAPNYSTQSSERMIHKEFGICHYRFIHLLRFNYNITELEKKEHDP